MFKTNKVILTLIILIISLTACGNKQTDRPFTVSIVDGFQSISPGSDVEALSRSVLSNMNGYLFKYNPDTKVHEPSIASSITLNDDTFTITLRDDVYFHNDNKVTADDVVYSIKRSAGFVEDFLTVDSILKKSITADCFTIVDDNTINIKIASENINNNILFSLYNTIIVPKDYPESSQTVNPISAGPYKFTSYIVGQEITFTKYDKSFEPVESIEEVTFKIISDDSASLFALQNGELDYLSILAKDEISLADNKNITITKNLANDTNTLFINNTLDVFKDKEIINAIKYAINKDELIKITTDGVGAVQASILSPYQVNYYNNNISTNEFNPSLSRKILEEKGYSNDNRLKINLKVVAENTVTVDMANLIKSYLADCYIDIVINEIPWSAYFEDVYIKKHFEATILQLAGYDNAYNTLRFFYTPYIGNLSGYSNEKYDAVVEALLLETDETKKQELFYQAQSILFYDTPSIFLGDTGKIVALNSKYTNLKFYPYWNIDIAKIKEVK